MKKCIELLFDKNDFGPGNFMLEALVPPFIDAFRGQEDRSKLNGISNRAERLAFYLGPYLPRIGEGREWRINALSRGDNKGYINVIATDLAFIRDYVKLLVLDTPTVAAISTEMPSTAEPATDL